MLHRHTNLSNTMYKIEKTTPAPTNDRAVGGKFTATPKVEAKSISESTKKTITPEIMLAANPM
jgi:hypothetical protein